MLLLDEGLVEGGHEPQEAVAGHCDGLGRLGLAGHQVIVILDLIDPCDLLVLAEVEEREELFAVVISADREDVIVPGLDDPGVGFALEYAVFGADLLQLAQSLENAVLSGALDVAERRVVPVHVASVEVTAVLSLDRVVVIGVIVELADLVACVQDRDAALGQQECVQHDIETDAAIQLPAVLLIFCRLDTAQRSGCAAQTRVAQTGIVVVELTAGVASVALAAQIVVQIFLVRHFGDAELLEVLIVKAPADIVVAAQVVEECVLVRQREYGLHLVTEQAHVVSRDSVPCAGHGGYVVEHVALGLIQCAKIRNDLTGFHNDFAKKQCAGADDLGGHVHQANQRVYLGKVAARRADLFPDVRRRIQTDDIYAVVAEVEHIRGHIVEYDGICIVEVPLIGPEGGHNDLACLFAPGEVAGCGLREYLGDGLLELVRNGPVIIEEIAVLIFLLARLRALCPLVVFAGVVHDEVQAYAHAACVAVVSQRGQIFHGAQLRLYFSEIRNRVAAVASILGALQKGHQVQIVDAAFLDVIQMALHALEVSCEAVGVHEHTEHIIALVPVGRRLARLVPLLEKRASLLVILIHHLTEVVKSLLIIVIEFAVQPLHLIVVPGQPLFKCLVPLFVFKHTFPPVGVFLQIYTDRPRCFPCHLRSLFGLIVECNRFHYKGNQYFCAILITTNLQCSFCALC